MVLARMRLFYRTWFPIETKVIFPSQNEAMQGKRKGFPQDGKTLSTSQKELIL